MVHHLISLFCYIIEFFAAHIVLSRMCERRIKKIPYWLIGSFLFFLLFLVNILFNNTIWINVICYTVISILYGLICFKISVSKILVVTFIMHSLCFLLEFASENLLTALYDTPLLAYRDSISSYILLASTSKISYFLVCVLFSKHYSNKSVSKYPVFYYIYPVILSITVITFWAIFTFFDLSVIQRIILAIVSVFLLISSLLLIFAFLHNSEKETELFLLKNEMDKIKTEKTYYDILEKQNNDLMIYAHDAKNHLTAIKNLNKDEQIDEYINKMFESLVAYSKQSRTNNHTLDVIINKYITECEIKNIKFSFDVHLKNLEYVDDYDLVAILGNLLDNALESAQNSQNREISLSTDYRNTYDVLIITNSCDTAPTTSNNKLVTSKDDKKLHGYGIKSVLKTLKKYNGDFDWEYDSHKRIFTSTVMLKNKI